MRRKNNSGGAFTSLPNPRETVSSRFATTFSASDPSPNQRRRLDMPPPSEIQNFFANSTVFLTGATGFLGQLALEKLLRSCPALKHVYILVRPKKGKDNQARFDEIFDSPVFDGLRRTDGNAFAEKVSLLRGDCSLPSLGLDERDTQTLLREVDCVFHFAATVRFDQSLKTATHINVRATRDLVALARQMKGLKAFVYCSTAYSFCTRKAIGEEFYPCKISGDSLLELVDILDDDMLEGVTNSVISPWPNTYVMTKAAAENIIQEHGTGLPITIIRPSIVIATLKEPLAGWIGTVFGFASVNLGAALGILRSLRGDGSRLADLVPADFVVNCAIAAAWKVGTDKTLTQNAETGVDRPLEKCVPIYNYVISNQNPIRWKTYVQKACNMSTVIPTTKMLRSVSFKFIRNKTLATISDLIYHRLPAHGVDIVLCFMGKTPVAVKFYQRYTKMQKLASYFSLRDWEFKDDNTKALWKSLNSTDRELFDFDLSGMSWEEMIDVMFKGGRVYLLKDPLETVPQGLRRAKIMSCVSWLFTLMLLCFVVFVFYRLVFN